MWNVYRWDGTLNSWGEEERSIKKFEFDEYEAALKQFNKWREKNPEALVEFLGMR